MLFCSKLHRVLPSVTPLENAVGPTSLRCWQFVREMFREHRSKVLPENPFDALALFVTIHDPQAWDIIIIRNHPMFENHVGVMISPVAFVHSMHIGSGPDTDDSAREVTIGFVHREPWNRSNRIARYRRLIE